MSKLKVPFGKGKQTILKSGKLVGLKTTASSKPEEQLYVEDKVLNNLGGFSVVKLDQEGNRLDDRLDELRAQESVELGTHVYHVEGSDRPLVPTGELYIVFKDGTNEEEQALTLNEYCLELVERRSSNYLIAKVTKDSPNPVKVAAALSNISLIHRVEADMDTLVDEYAFLSPSDNLLTHQWQFRNEGFVMDSNYQLKKGADAKIIDAWERIGNTGNDQITIAVIDNGFDLTHPDLQHKVHKPFDLWNNSSNVLMGDPRFTHGTPCASVALASSNGLGIVGAAPNSRFMPVSGTSFSLRATEQMFDYCIKSGADVISCSWGTTDPAFTLSPLKERAISRAVKEGRNGKGCVVLFAAGNEDLDYLNFYATHPDVICVAASNSKDQHAVYSNRGMEVTVCAPSNGDWPIIAARAWWDDGLSYETGLFRWWRDGKSRGQRYKHFGGTSAATPLVAGICALLLSVNPELTARQVKDILKKTADKIGGPSEYNNNGHSLKYGYGRVNADRAVAEAIRLKEGGNPVVEVNETVTSGKGIFRFSVQKQTPSGFGVQVGAFAEYGNVLIHAERYQSLFNQPIIVSINELRGKTVYKVVVGAFDRRTDASLLLNQMKARGIEGFVRDIADLE